MTKEQLNSLIDKMNNADNSSNNSISLKAHKQAEKLSTLSLVPLLKEFLQEKNKPKDKNIRNSAYFILGNMLKNNVDKESCAFFIQQLTVEKDKYVLSSILDLLEKIDIPADIDITPIILDTKSDKWLIRHSAISALGSCNTKESKEVLAFYLNQSDEKQYKYEIIYDNAVTLGSVN